jgi:pyridoxamine 5'-phosphate oxidase
VSGGDTAEDLDERLRGAWALLSAAVRDRRSPLHCPALATTDPDGAPSARIVTLRGADAQRRLLWCHADLRSPKAAEAADRTAAWLFYDKARGLQVRARGPTAVHAGDDRARAAWEASRRLARRCYLAEPGPGGALDAPGCGLSADVLAEVPDAAALEAGWPRFCVVETTVAEIDRVDLSIGGHRRSSHVWDGTRWTGSWRVP